MQLGTILSRHDIHKAPVFLLRSQETSVHSNHLQSEELNAVKQVYEGIFTQDWFSQTDEARLPFARYLIDTYSIGQIEPTRFRKIVECSA